MAGRAVRRAIVPTAAEDVGGAARGKADDDAHRPRWIGLCTREARHDRQRGPTGHQMQKLPARKFHGFHPFAHCNDREFCTSVCAAVAGLTAGEVKCDGQLVIAPAEQLWDKIRRSPRLRKGGKARDQRDSRIGICVIHGWSVFARHHDGRGLDNCLASIRGIALKAWRQSCATAIGPISKQIIVNVIITRFIIGLLLEWAISMPSRRATSITGWIEPSRRCTSTTPMLEPARRLPYARVGGEKCGLDLPGFRRHWRGLL